MTDKKRKNALNWLKHLPEPIDYFKGIGTASPVIPEKLMFFMRRNRKWLERASRIKQHHHRYVLIIVLETPGSIIINGKEFFLIPQTAFLMCPHQIHTYKNIETWDMHWIYITFELQNEKQLEPIKNISIPLTTPSIESLDEIMRIYTQREPLDRYRITELTIKTSAFLNLLLETHEKNEKTFTNRNPLERDDLLNQINHFIIQNLKDGISTEELSKSINCSPGHLRKTFRQKYGLSIGSYIHDKKLQKAQSLLMQTSLSIKEIAYECGFKQLPSFTRFFRQAKGHSPKAYRERLGG